MAGAVAAAAPKVGPGELRTSLGRDGPQVTVRRLVAEHRWEAVLDRMGSGEAAWIALAPQLAPGTDAGSAEGLGVALAAALPKDPAAVLRAIDPQDGVVLGAHRVCASPFIEPKPEFVAHYRREALAAVSGVREPKLRAVRDACLAVLRKG
jgi:hypothetical protein